MLRVVTLVPASKERPRTSAGDCGEVGGGTAGTLGDGFSDFRSSRARRLRATKNATSAAWDSRTPELSGAFMQYWGLPIRRRTGGEQADGTV